MQRRLAALLVLALALLAGVAAPAAAQAVPGLTATLTVPSSTTLGVSVQATAVFTPPTPSPGPLQVAIVLNGAAADATLATVSNTPELTNCTLRLASSQVRCDWTPAGGGPQTLTVTINPVAVHLLVVAATGAPAGGIQANLDTSPFAIIPQGPTTTTATTLAPTTAPTTPTSATVAPTSAAVAPTNAAAPGSLPPTGGSDASAFIAVVVLALGAFLLIMARKVRET